MTNRCGSLACAVLLTCVLVGPAGPAAAGGKLAVKDVQKLNELFIAGDNAAVVERCEELADKKVSGSLLDSFAYICAGSNNLVGNLDEATAYAERMDKQSVLYQTSGVNLLGSIAYLRCDYEGALDLYHAAVPAHEEHGKDTTSLKTNTALVASRQGRHSSALEALVLLIDPSPDHPWATYWHMVLIDGLYASGDREAAVKEATALVGRDHDSLSKFLAGTQSSANNDVLLPTVYPSLDTWASIGQEAGLTTEEVESLRASRDAALGELLGSSGACQDAHGDQWRHRALALGLIQPPPPPPGGAPSTATPADTDKDGIADDVDACPTEAEVINGVDDRDGCPDEALARVLGRLIQIEEKIHFATDSDEILPESFDVLDQVAAILTEWPDIRRVRVEGHTDKRGGDDHNLDLSDRRAASVRAYLMGKGIDGERLESKGFGEQRPLAFGDSDGDHAANRRVEFFIVDP